MQEGAFLDSLQRQAQELDLRGWAQNTEDGRVEVVVEGKPEAVRQVLRWCYSDRAQRSTPPPYTGNALARSRRLQGQVNKSGWRFARSVGLVKERLMKTYLGAELWSRMYELGNQVG